MERVAHSFFFSFQVVFVVLVHFYFDWHILYDFEAVTFETYTFNWVI